MSASLLPLLVAVPLLAAAALVLIPHRTRAGNAVLLGVLTICAIAGGALVVDQMSGEVIAHSVGLWPVGSPFRSLRTCSRRCCRRSPQH